MRQLRERLADVLAERSELESSIDEGLITVAGVKSRLVALRDEESRLREDEARAHRNDAHAALVDAAQAGLPRPRDHKVSIADAVRAKAEVRKRWAAMPLEPRRQVLKALFSVTVFGGRGSDRVKITGPGYSLEP